MPDVRGNDTPTNYCGQTQTDDFSARWRGHSAGLNFRADNRACRAGLLIPN
jgi:hypothetical protein